MSETETQLEREVGAALAAVTSDFYGRGPRSTRTWILDRLVFSALREPFTVGDDALIAAGKSDLVRDVRMTFQDVMGRTFVDAVESLTRKSVVGYHSQIVFDPPFALEWFLLDPSRDAGTPGRPAVREPGEVGDADAATDDAPALVPPRRAGGDGALARGSWGDGAQRASISNAVNRIVSAGTGRGATAARSYVLDGFVLCVLEDAVTTVERTLIEADCGELARHLRRGLIETLAHDLRATVAPLVGREVAAIEAQLVMSPDAVLIAFVLEPTAAGARQRD